MVLNCQLSVSTCLPLEELRLHLFPNEEIGKIPAVLLCPFVYFLIYEHLKLQIVSSRFHCCQVRQIFRLKEGILNFVKALQCHWWKVRVSCNEIREDVKGVFPSLVLLCTQVRHENILKEFFSVLLLRYKYYYHATNVTLWLLNTCKFFLILLIERDNQGFWILCTQEIISKFPLSPFPAMFLCHSTQDLFFQQSCISGLMRLEGTSACSAFVHLFLYR